MRAVAHSFDADKPAVRPNSFEDRTAVAIVVDLEPGERAAGQAGKQLAGPCQDRPLIFLTIAFDATVASPSPPV